MLLSVVEELPLVLREINRSRGGDEARKMEKWSPNRRIIMELPSRGRRWTIENASRETFSLSES